jgi:hypothetical protein
MTQKMLALKNMNSKQELYIKQIRVMKLASRQKLSSQIIQRMKLLNLLNGFSKITTANGINLRQYISLKRTAMLVVTLKLKN